MNISVSVILQHNFTRLGSVRVVTIVFFVAFGTMFKDAFILH